MKSYFEVKDDPIQIEDKYVESKEFENIILDNKEKRAQESVNTSDIIGKHFISNLEKERTDEIFSK